MNIYVTNISFKATDSGLEGTISATWRGNISKDYHRQADPTQPWLWFC